MKAKKALKRLNRVETLLATVIDQFGAATPEVHGLLDDAKTSVTSATKALAATPARKAPAKAAHTQAAKIPGAERKRISVAAKNRTADANRNDTSNPARPSRKIA